MENSTLSRQWHLSSLSLLPKVKVLAPSRSSLLKEKKIILTLVEMMRKTLFKAIEIGVKTIETGERDGAYLWI